MSERDDLGSMQGQDTGQSGRAIGPVTGGSSWAAEAPTEESAPNPLTMVLDRMHGRWLWAILLGCLLAPVFAGLGFTLGPVKYDATAVLSVESRLETLVEETIETQQINVGELVAQQAQLVQDPQVLYKAFADSELAKWEATRPSYRDAVASGVKVSVPRGAALFLVTFTDKDPRFAADAVNAVVRAYVEIFAPNTEIEFQQKLDKIQVRIDASRRRIEDLKRQRIELLEDSQYAITDVQAIVDTNVDGIRRLESFVAAVDGQLARIREEVAVQARARAEAESREVAAEELEPRVDDRVEPTIEQLAAVDSELPTLEENLNRTQVAFGLVASQFGPAHQQYRRAKANLEAQENNFTARLAAATAEWKKGPGRTFTWGALSERKATLSAELEELRTENKQLALDQIQAEDLAGKIAGETAELAKLEDRRQGLDRERDSIRQGRVTLRTEAVPAFQPTSDKKIPAAAAGAFGGFAVSFAIFFLIGTLDQKTFGVRQLQDQRNSLRVLGVMPNMDEVEDDADTVTLATDCVHRIRARIESRRSHHAGYALMVSSPFQGDGKTTLAVSLGWSYAESGYKTLLLDADFIGRAMSHQFGRLKDPGLREIIRDGQVDDEIQELGHPNLSLLGVGFDRRISAANLSPRIMSQVIDSLRGRFDLIIIDSGPITASIEAMPVASAVDGTVLALRRGRSRARLAECIEDIRAVGTDYLGVVLNYAERSDCLRYGSTSRMSASVQTALEEGDGSVLSDASNPMFGEMHGRDD